MNDLAKNPGLFKRLYHYSQRRPLVILAIIGLLVFLLYEFLDSTVWGAEFNRLALSMLSSEIGAWRMFMEGISFWYIILRLLVADISNVIIDLYIVSIVLNIKMLRSIIDAISRWGRACIRDIKAILSSSKSKDEESNPSAMEHFQNKLNHIANNPSKAGLFTVFWLCLIPKPIPIPGFPGGVGIAVLVVRYNKYGFRGWMTISIATLIRTFGVLGIYYAVAHFFPK